MKRLALAVLLALTTPCLASRRPVTINRVYRTYIMEERQFIDEPVTRWAFWEIRREGDSVRVKQLKEEPRRIDLSTIEYTPQTDPPAPRFVHWPTFDQQGRIRYRWYHVAPDGLVTNVKD